MMKKYLYFLFLASYISLAQVTDLVDPKSWTNNLTDDNIEVVTIPFEDLARYIEEDLRTQQQSLAKPYRFGAKLQTNVTRYSHGETINLDNGDRIWRVGFESIGAKTINFIISDYELIDGAELYIYNSDRSQKMGPYTSNENTSINEITTWPIDGDKVYMEFYEPADIVDQSTFTIKEMVHGYRSVTSQDVAERALNDSGPCNLDADCPLGNNFDQQKRSVVMLVSGGNGFCSGTLVNNTAQDRRPLILTANHCGAGPGNEAPVGGTASWAFRFDWRSPNPVCADPIGTPSTDGPFLQTGNGVIVRASDGESDILLLEATAPNAIPTNWGVVFAGWSRSTSLPSFTTGIHHPSGDIMKICRDNNAPSRTNVSFNGFINRVWFINGNTQGGWEQGVTEPGSSGSQLLDDNGLLIGVLSGGLAACLGNVDNGDIAFYGRLDEGWSAVGSFLDPSPGNLATTIGHLENVLSTDLFELNEFITVYPNPNNGVVYFKSNLQLPGNIDYTLMDVQGKIVLKNSIENNFNVETKIQLSNIPAGIYLLRFESGDMTEVKKIILN